MRTQLQIHISWATTQEEAERNALEEWPNGGMPFPKQDIKNPEDFANIAKLVRIENFANRMLISADLEEHTAQIQKFVDMGFDEVYLHNVGRDQAAFIETFGTKVLPNLRPS
jgi:alkanesulfonate monooxygenase SsuD/methylene tetrahydromethanopterin reductase-like flavin-dependent oxidoreductase (luciferase family)